MEVSAESMERVVKVLRNRFKCQTYLSKQLLGLSSGVLCVFKEARERRKVEGDWRERVGGREEGKGREERERGKGGGRGRGKGREKREGEESFIYFLTDDHTMDLGPDIEDLFPDPPSSKLTRWKPLSLSEVQVGASLYMRLQKIVKYHMQSFFSCRPLSLRVYLYSTNKRKLTVSLLRRFNSMMVCL